METQMKDCKGMMQQMQQMVPMQGRGGMMNQPPSDAPHSH